MINTNNFIDTVNQYASMEIVDSNTTFVPASALEASVVFPSALPNHYENTANEWDISDAAIETTDNTPSTVQNLESKYENSSNIDEKSRKKQEIRASIARARLEQDNVDVETFLHRSEHIQQAVAITDILLSGRLPFLVKSLEEATAPLKSTSKSLMSGTRKPNSRSLKPISQSQKTGMMSEAQSTTGNSIASSKQFSSNKIDSKQLEPEAKISRSRTMSQDTRSVQSTASSSMISPPPAKSSQDESFSVAENSKTSTSRPRLTSTSSNSLPPSSLRKQQHLTASDNNFSSAAVVSNSSSNSSIVGGDHSSSSSFDYSRLPHGGLIDKVVNGGTVSEAKFHALMTPFARSLPALPFVTADGKLQYVLEQLNNVKSDLDPSKVYFEAGLIFYEMGVYDRAVVCLDRATSPSDAAVLVDTLKLPNDIHYQRKVERMSPRMQPKFLAERRRQREAFIEEESERQRQRVLAAHCELTRLLSLEASVRDLWRAQRHLTKAMSLSTRDEERHATLRYFHRLLVTFTEDVLDASGGGGIGRGIGGGMNDTSNNNNSNYNNKNNYSNQNNNGTFRASGGGNLEFGRDQQILRGSAGPLSDAHLIVLLDLAAFERDNPSLQDWLGRRYTEKCLFAEAAEHYEAASTLRRRLPSRGEILQLWRKKPQAAEEEANSMAAEIRANVHKAIMHSYQNFDGDIYALAAQDATKDLSHFPGKHDEMCTIVYRPPPQGWTGQR